MVCLDDELSTSLIIQPDEPHNNINSAAVDESHVQDISNNQNGYSQNLDLLSAPSIRNPGFQNIDREPGTYKETFVAFTTPQTSQPTLTGYFPLGSPYKATTAPSKETFSPSDTYKPKAETTTKWHTPLGKARSSRKTDSAMHIEYKHLMMILN